LLDDKPHILAALREVECLVRARPDWPEDWAELPCAVVTETANRPAARYDDQERLTELTYLVRVFAARASELAEAASAVDGVLRGLGYERVLAWEDNGQRARQKVMRYRIFR
jgi:hypothetical protein